MKRQRLDRLLAGLAQGLLTLAVPGVDLDGEADIALLDDEAGDHATLDHALAAVVVDDGGERLENLGFADLRHGIRPFRNGFAGFLSGSRPRRQRLDRRGGQPARCTI